MSFKVSSAKEYFDTLHDRFNPEGASKMDATFQWELGDAGTWHAIIQNQELTVVEGEHPKPTVRFQMKPDEYVKMVNGDLDGRMAVLRGKLKIKGKRMLAAKLQQVFPAA